MTPVAVADVGTNSTRLLIADGTAELQRESIVTRLGDRLERDGALREDAQQRVLEVLSEYRRAADRHGCERAVALMTSAVRDADNGPAFADRVRAAGFDGRVLSGEEEARLTFAGATAHRPDADATGLAVIDIGGGSTEIVTRDFGASFQVGVVRHGERHDDLQELAADVRGVFEAATLPHVTAAVAVAGTPTAAAAIDLGGYDRDRVEGYRLTVSRLREIRARLEPLTPEQRAAVPGLHPARARVMLPGLTILVELLGVLGLDEVEASERDILWGAASALGA
jgi:exopolyphosphatase/guanosine-5'-triphosphate,3'-diphosphate pyrophosphatase